MQHTPETPPSHHTYYQGRLGKPPIVQGEGDAAHLETEAAFLGHHGWQIAQIFHEEDLRAAAINDGTTFNAVGFPDGFGYGNEKICGLLSQSNTDMEGTLQELDWKNL